MPSLPITVGHYKDEINYKGFRKALTHVKGMNTQSGRSLGCLWLRIPKSQFLSQAT